MVHRKKQERGARNRLRAWIGTAAAVIVVSVIAFAVLESNNGGGDANSGNSGGATLVRDADIVIPAGEVSETAKFYPAEIDGTKLEVIAVKAPDGTIRTAFNTCQVCYDSGRGYYKQDGDVLVCQNCGNRFKMSQVEVVSGGCNPVPIFDENKTVDKANIIVSADYLKESAAIFANWKAEY
jgi:uncharacterized membrane protein